MPVFLSISKHAPENCPAFSEKHRKSSIEFFDKMDVLAKKNGVKIIGWWTDFPQHLVYMVLESSFEALQKFQMEPLVMDWLAWNSMELKNVLTNEDVLAMLKKFR